MTTIKLSYTPNYAGANRVKRSHIFPTPEAATAFLDRMKRLYPDTKEL
ncbi:MAG: hypothetical protein Q8O62_09980 [Aequorivita sp.]|nr:hypothetical protein [Aequorivita sp.]